MIAFVDSLAQFADAIVGGVVAYVAVFCRVAAIAFLAPGLGEAFVPTRVRLAGALALTIVVAPGAPTGAPPQDAIGWLSIVSAETGVGLVLGFALRLTIIALQITGTITAQHLQLSQLFGPGVGHDQESALSGILVMAALAIAASQDTLAVLAGTMIESYSAFPLGGGLEVEPSVEGAVIRAGDALRLAFSLSTPFVILGLAYSITLGAMNRAMPALMASFVGAPAILFAGLMLFAGASSVLLTRWSEIHSALIADPLLRVE
jgi:flagellar biosynthetic protein FliR